MVPRGQWVLVSPEESRAALASASAAAPARACPVAVWTPTGGWPTFCGAGRSGKLARLTEMMEEALAAGDRVLVFTQFAEMGEILRQHLEGTFGREVLFLHGGVSKGRRDEMVDRFQGDGGNDDGRRGGLLGDGRHRDGDGPRILVLTTRGGPICLGRSSGQTWAHSP